MSNYMRPYTDVADELARRNANSYTPPTIPQVKQTPVDIPGVLGQTTNLYQPYPGQLPKDNK